MPITLSHDEARDLSVKVYKYLLGPSDTQRMLEKDNDGGKKLRERAGSYDRLSRAYAVIFEGGE